MLRPRPSSLTLNSSTSRVSGAMSGLTVTVVSSTRSSDTHVLVGIKLVVGPKQTVNDRVTVSTMCTSVSANQTPVLHLKRVALRSNTRWLGQPSPAAHTPLRPNVRGEIYPGAMAFRPTCTRVQRIFLGSLCTCNTTHQLLSTGLRG